MSRMRKIILSCMLVLIMLLLGKPTEVKAGTEAAADRIEIKIYYNNPCASCHEEKTYEAIAAQELQGISDQYPHDIWIYNCFKPSDKEEYLKDLEAHGWEEQDSTLPMLILGDHKICGEKEIKAQLRELFLQEAEKQTQGEELQYFSTSSCKDCARVKELLQKNGWKAKEYSIDDADNLDKLYEYFQTYEVKEEDQQVPILFWNRQYYSGATAIEAALNGRQNTSSEIDETELAKKTGEGACIHMEGYRKDYTGRSGEWHEPLFSITSAIFIVSFCRFKSIGTQGGIFLSGRAILCLSCCRAGNIFTGLLVQQQCDGWSHGCDKIPVYVSGNFAWGIKSS